MDLVERFIKYVKIDTESDPNSPTFPTTQKQKDLGKVLVQEMVELGIVDAHMGEDGIVYGSIPKNVEGAPIIGFIAHMDTSPDMSGKNVNPRIIQAYDGGKIVLNEKLNISMDPVDFPSLKGVVGDDLIVTDGTTLLGADDKAGIAEIMDLAEKIMKDSSIKHGDIKLAFTPDETVPLSDL